jgi:hypothetical protein
MEVKCGEEKNLYLRGTRVKNVIFIIHFLSTAYLQKG